MPPADNLFNQPGVTSATSELDGYFVMLKHLEEGKHAPYRRGLHIRAGCGILGGHNSKSQRRRRGLTFGAGAWCAERSLGPL
jgi:hypothetical protein